MEYFSGLRPLFNGGKDPSKKSREYEIWWSNKNAVSIYGGKLTGFQTMARKCLDFMNLKGTENITHSTKETNSNNPYQEKYGRHADKVYDIYCMSEEYQQFIINDITIAEIIFYIRYTSVKVLDDLLTRRLSLTYYITSYSNYDKIINDCLEIMQNELDLDDCQCEYELESYYYELERFIK